MSVLATINACVFFFVFFFSFIVLSSQIKFEIIFLSGNILKCQNGVLSKQNVRPGIWSSRIIENVIFLPFTLKTFNNDHAYTMVLAIALPVLSYRPAKNKKQRFCDLYGLRSTGQSRYYALVGMHKSRPQYMRGA